MARTRTGHPIWMALVVGLAGCGQVLGIDDWEQAGAGGAGGEQNGAATVTSGGAQTSSAASGMSGTEACTNGVDDDADGLADCADSDCVGYTCSGMVPDEWSGPIAMALAATKDALPSCGPEWATQTDFLTGTLTAPAAQCSSCSCGPPSGGSCTLSPQSHITYYKDTMCTMGDTSTALGPNQCIVATSSPSSIVSAYMVSAEASPSFGSCLPNSAPPLIAPAEFDKVARICEGPVHGEGCGTDKACIPPPPSSFRPSLCIYRQVNDELNPTCPAGYDPLPFFYKDIVDTRACVPCQCGGATGQTCQPTAHLYGNSASCTGGVVQTLDDCNGIGPGYAVSLRLLVEPGVPAGGSCAPMMLQPAPIGNAYGGSRTLVCCLP